MLLYNEPARDMQSLRRDQAGRWRCEEPAKKQITRATRAPTKSNIYMKKPPEHIDLLVKNKWRAPFVETKTNTHVTA